MLRSYRQERGAEKESPGGRCWAGSPQLRGLGTVSVRVPTPVTVLVQEQQGDIVQTAPRVKLKNLGDHLSFFKETVKVWGEEGFARGTY